MRASSLSRRGLRHTVREVLLVLPAPLSHCGKRESQAVCAGDVFAVADKGNHRVAIFELAGTFVRNIGKKGSKAGQFESGPSLVALDAERLYVVQAADPRVQAVSHHYTPHTTTSPQCNHHTIQTTRLNTTPIQLPPPSRRPCIQHICVPGVSNGRWIAIALDSAGIHLSHPWDMLWRWQVVRFDCKVSLSRQCAFVT